MIIFGDYIIATLFLSRNRAEDQAGRSKQKRSPTKYSNRWNLPEIYNISTSKKSYIQHLLLTYSSYSIKIKSNFTQYQHAFHTTKIIYSFFFVCFLRGTVIFG